MKTTQPSHKSFVCIEKETSNAQNLLSISYSYAGTRFGNAIFASTDQGLCYLALVDDKREAYENLKLRFRNATLQEEETAYHHNALAFLEKAPNCTGTLKLHLLGTDFQQKVWSALLDIPFGQLVTYSDIANQIENPRALRAVGTAIGNNPVAYIIPCHRVIRTDGALGGYRWGLDKKQTILTYEGI